MGPTVVVQDGFGRIRSLVRRAADGLDAEQLAFRPTPNANSIAWLLWHLTRIQDSHLGEAVGGEQVWVTGPWAAALGFAPDAEETGYGHTPEQVAAVRPPGQEPLVGYHEAVVERTLAALATWGPDDLDRIIDRSYDPPVSLGVRLVSVLSDNLQHVGQALYLRGMLPDLR
jgi:hypothetical protein